MMMVGVLYCRRLLESILVSVVLQTSAGVCPGAAVFAGDVQPRRGVQCNPHRADDSDVDPGRTPLPQLQGGNRQRRTARADAELLDGESCLENALIAISVLCAPCWLWDCKNRPALFPDWNSI